MASPSIKFSYSVPDKTNPRPSRQPVDSPANLRGARTRACRVLAILPTHGFCPQRRSRQGSPVSLRPLRPQHNEPNRYSSPQVFSASSLALPRTKRTQSLFLSAVFSASPRLRVKSGPLHQQNEPNRYSSPRFSPRPRVSASNPALSLNKTNPIVIPLRDFLRVPASPRQIRPSPSTKRTQSLFLSAIFSASPRLRVQSRRPSMEVNLPKTIVS